MYGNRQHRFTPVFISTVVAIVGWIAFSACAVSAAGIAFDAATTVTGRGNTVSGAVTVTGKNVILLCGVGETENVDIVNSAYYDGVQMALIDKEHMAPKDNQFTYLFSLIDPHTGTHTLSVNNAVPNDSIAATCVSYTGVDQSAEPEAHTFGVGAGSPASLGITTVTNGSWVALFAVNIDAVWDEIATNAVPRSTRSSDMWFDSNGPVSPPATDTMVITFPGSRTWSWQQVALKPYVPTFWDTYGTWILYGAGLIVLIVLLVVIGHFFSFKVVRKTSPPSTPA